MKAELKYLHSPDIDDLESYKPVDEGCFQFLLQVIVGIDGKPGEESFDVLVTTPRFLEGNYSESELLFGKDKLIIFQYDFEAIKNKISDYIYRIEEDNWHLIAEKLDRIGKWEFRDYWN